MICYYQFYYEISNVIHDRTVLIANLLIINIQAVLNCFCYLLQVSVRSLAITIQFFTVLLYELYRSRKNQSLNQKQRFNQLTCGNNSVSNESNLNSRPVGTPTARRCHLDMQLRVNSKGMMGKGLDQIRGMININPDKPLYWDIRPTMLKLN